MSSLAGIDISLRELEMPAWDLQIGPCVFMLVALEALPCWRCLLRSFEWSCIPISSRIARICKKLISVTAASNTAVQFAIPSTNFRGRSEFPYHGAKQVKLAVCVPICSVWKCFLKRVITLAVGILQCILLLLYSASTAAGLTPCTSSNLDLGCPKPRSCAVPEFFRCQGF